MNMTELGKPFLGQPRFRRLLNTALAGQGIAHAYLLSGPDSSGLVKAALALACALKCQAGIDGPCGACATCRRIAQGNHSDIHLVLPEGDTLKLGQVRRLQSTLHMKSNEGAEKVGIIGFAEKMSLEAANSLLKLLEDPPLETVVILTSRHPGHLLPTILSRCQEVRLTSRPPQALAAELLTLGARDSEAVGLAARLCDGDQELAERWLEQEDLVGLHAEIISELSTIDQADPLSLSQTWEARGKEKDGLLLQLNIGLLLLRDAMVQSAGATLPAVTAKGTDALIDAFGLAGLHACIRTMLKTQDYIRSNVNARLALDAMFLALQGVRQYDGSSGYSL